MRMRSQGFARYIRCGVSLVIRRRVSSLLCVVQKKRLWCLWSHALGLVRPHHTPGSRSVERRQSHLSRVRGATRALPQLWPSEARASGSYAKTLENNVAAVGGTEAANKILQEQAQKGQGKPSCLEKEKIVVELHAYEDHIEIRGAVSEDLQKLLSRLGIAAEQVRRLSLSTFQKTFRPIVAARPNCRYNVSVVEYSRFTDPRAGDAISSSFWIKTRRRAIKE